MNGIVSCAALALCLANARAAEVGGKPVPESSGLPGQGTALAGSPAAAAGLRALGTKLLEKGPKSAFADKFGNVLPKLFQFPSSTAIAQDFVMPGGTTDNRQRAFVAFPEPAGPSRASYLLMALEWNLEARRKEDLYLALDREGRLQAGVYCEGRLTEEGDYVKGTCLPERLDPRSDQALMTLQRELDFWLAGKRRNPAGEKPIVVKMAPGGKLLEPLRFDLGGGGP